MPMTLYSMPIDSFGSSAWSGSRPGA